MAHESFDDAATAAVMNKHFVNVKVDREERPDLDGVYMQAVQAMTGHGGWPMTVFLTPDGAPFYGGTYFPPTDRPGTPSFTKVLRAVAGAYHNRRDSVLQSATLVREIYRNAEPAAQPEGELTPHMLELGYRAAAQQYDIHHGGFGGAPKFPQAMALDFLLRYWARSGTQEALDMARQTFMKMAHGGIYDQIGGGFARYAVDATWLTPHFEKMLYDNALLIRLGAHLYQATGDDEVRRVTQDTIQWLAREMTSPEGGFYASLDADSEGKEGKFYLWSEAELDRLLGADATQIKTYYGVSTTGNFDGENILHVPTDIRAVASRAGVSVEQLLATIQRAKGTLYAARSARVHPGRDEKILAAWNGLALRGLAEAARIFNSADITQLALRNAEFLAAEMIRDGRIMRVYKDGTTRIPGFLTDYAAVALGFLALFEHTDDTRWISLAKQLASSIMEWFWDNDTTAFYDTARDAEALITRPRDITDNAVPSGNSLAVELLLKLAELTGDTEMRRRGEQVLRSLSADMLRFPMAFCHLFAMADMAVHGAETEST
jgi:uncharacterized protein YyaL (SSP411 family)